MESKLGGIGEGAERSLGTRWDGPAHQRFGYAILSHVLHILTHYEYCGYALIQQMPQYCTYKQYSTYYRHTAKKAVLLLHLRPRVYNNKYIHGPCTPSTMDTILSLVHPCHAWGERKGT